MEPCDEGVGFWRRMRKRMGVVLTEGCAILAW